MTSGEVADDERLMRRALRLAIRGQGRVEPNPMVGCVIVRDGRVLGEGHHARFGGPHAEVIALRNCSASPRGAAAFVTLEPCCYTGKTPPCVEALLAAGVRRVVAAMPDPNPRVRGRGFAALRRAGVEVRVGVLRTDAERLNAPFSKLTRRGRPWVIAKWAQSLDGKLATATGDSRWITSPPARRHAHQTRGRVDAIVVGIGTVLADDPLLTCRHGRLRRVATRVVLDSRLRMPPRARLVTTCRSAPTLVFCSPVASVRRRLRLEAAGCEVCPVGRDKDGLALAEALDELGRRKMSNVLVEGGPRVLSDFLQRGLVDEAHVYVAPLLIGDRAAPGPASGLHTRRVADALRFDEPRVRRLGPDWLFVQRVAGLRAGLPGGG